MTVVLHSTPPVGAPRASAWSSDDDARASVALHAQDNRGFGTKWQTEPIPLVLSGESGFIEFEFGFNWTQPDQAMVWRWPYQRHEAGHRFLETKPADLQPSRYLPDENTTTG